MRHKYSSLRYLILKCHCSINRTFLPIYCLKLKIWKRLGGGNPHKLRADSRAKALPSFPSYSPSQQSFVDFANGEKHYSFTVISQKAWHVLKSSLSARHLLLVVMAVISHFPFLVIYFLLFFSLGRSSSPTQFCPISRCRRRLLKRLLFSRSRYVILKKSRTFKHVTPWGRCLFLSRKTVYFKLFTFSPGWKVIFKFLSDLNILQMIQHADRNLL